MDWTKGVEARRARVGIVGLGYVGLPLAVAFARRGFKVTGIEAHPKRAADIRAGRSYIEDVSSEELKRLVKQGFLSVDPTGATAGKLDAILICVQTPLRKTREPDISNILNACRAVAKRLRKGQLVVLESTTYPGTTEEAVRPVLEESGLEAGKDFFLAFSP
jgi:UDP-N-acetyl-D-glucosamine dehydrogenase